MTDTMPLDPDTIIHLMAVGASVLLLLVLIAGHVRLGLKVPLAGMLVGGALYLILSSTTLTVPRTVIPALDYLSLLTPFWTWLFAWSLIERMPPQRLLVD